MKRKCDIEMDFRIDDEEICSFIKAPTPEEHHAIEFTGEYIEEEKNEIIYPQKEAEDITVKEFYDKYIARTQEQCIEEERAPQRSKEWKEARKFPLTASDYGNAIGANKYSSPDETVRKKLWDTFSGNAATQWGSKMEDKASEAFMKWARLQDPDAILHSFGILKYAETPWLAASPDGILEWTKHGKKQYDLVEFKCPTKTFTLGHPYDSHENNIPAYYKAQMLGVWGYINGHGGIMIHDEMQTLKDTWFVVWQPKTLWITQLEFTNDEWLVQFEKLRVWYFEKWLPALVWNYNKRLEKGEIKPQCNPVCL